MRTINQIENELLKGVSSSEERALLKEIASLTRANEKAASDMDCAMSDYERIQIRAARRFYGKKIVQLREKLEALKWSPL